MTLVFTISISNIVTEQIYFPWIPVTAYIGDYLEEEKYGFCIHCNGSVMCGTCKCAEHSVTLNCYTRWRLFPFILFAVTLMGGTFDLFDGHCDWQNGLQTHFACKCNIAYGVVQCEQTSKSQSKENCQRPLNFIFRNCSNKSNFPHIFSLVKQYFSNLIF